MTTVAIRRPTRKIGRQFGAGILPPTTDLDRAWKTGFDLGRQGIKALAPTGWPVMLKDAFYEGYGKGEEQAEADREDDFLEDMARLATCNRPEGGDLW